MFRTAIVAAVFASAAFAAGCGDDSSMMVMPETDAGMTPPTPPPPPPDTGIPTPPPPPPMDGGPGTVCTPSASDPLCTGASTCQCDNSGIATFLAENPAVAENVETMSRCEPGSMNRCGFAAINLPPEMTSFAPFDCAQFVNNDLWLEGSSPVTSSGSYDYPGGNGEFLAAFDWSPDFIHLCSGLDCYAAFGVSTMPEYNGARVHLRFSEDCQHVLTEYYDPGATSPSGTRDFGWVQDR